MNVLDSKKTSYNILEKLGEGSQGITYLLEDKKHIVKLFNQASDASELKSKINFLIHLGLDKKVFAIPLREITQPKNGYIAEFASGMISLSNLKLSKKTDSLSDWYKSTGGLIRRYELLIRLASALRHLHSKGLAYCDLSPNNIFISDNPKFNQVFIIDLDNLRYKSSIFENIYTPFYGAPEIVSNKAPNSTMSDCFSFAIVAFELLTLNHPLIGDYVAEGEPELEEQALAGKIPWVEHATDSINKRSTGLPSEKVIPVKLLDLFKRNFEEGLGDWMKRPSMGEWVDGLRLALNELLKCGNENCELFYPYKNSCKCTFCGFEPKHVTKIQMRRWEEVGIYDKERNEIINKFCIELRPEEEILMDENTEKEITVFNFLLPEKDEMQSILKIRHMQERGTSKLELTPLNSIKFYISPRTGLEEGKESRILNSVQKIKVVEKDQTDKQKYMLHLKGLDVAQRVLTID